MLVEVALEVKKELEAALEVGREGRALRAGASVLGYWVKPCGTRVGNKERWKVCRTPTQDPSTDLFRAYQRSLA